MRIQEHIYQGFFGLKKKEDAGKYYSERISKMKGFDKDLDGIIESFQKILANHQKKLASYNEFLGKPNKETFQNVRKEIEKLEGMFDEDELANDKEQRYILKGAEMLKELSKNEESNELNNLEKESLSDMNELYRLLKAIEPVWQAQIDFIKQTDEIIVKDPKNIRILSDILKEEGDILRMEETLLRKIDLKTGTILRKATLKERDIERTKSLDLNYREVQHIR